jgi:hypothetical protein
VTNDSDLNDGIQSSARATKQRSELLQSFDTLSSHFVTTFTALSTALAQCSSEPNAPKSDTKKPSDLNRWPKGRSRVFLAILVGPSTGSARSKMVLGIDGLETKVWGIIDNADVDESGSEGPENESEDDEADDSEDEESDNNDEGDVIGDSEDEEHSDEEGSEPSPPRSRSPTPDPELSYPTYQTYAERQQALHLADRSLARTLASADAEGNSMAADMGISEPIFSSLPPNIHYFIAPTQTHVLLRAPRRFQHPAWIPRQNLSASMESTLDEFLEESRHPRRDTALEKKRRGQRARVEGVWITCRNGLGEADGDKWNVGDVEDDEMIWWSWNGRLVGFSDW